MLTEEPFITIEQLFKRWPGMPYDEMGDEITKLFKKRHKDDDPFQVKFPQPFIRRGVERRNPNTGNIVWNADPLESAPFCNDYGYDFEGICFKIAAIEEYEECHPEVFYPIVDADELSELEVVNDYIPALEAARQLKMSPAAFVRYLWEHREALPVTGLTTKNRYYFYGQDDPFEEVYSGVKAEIEDAAEMLPKISIHRLDWENHLKALASPSETEAADAEEEAFKARLAEVVADYKAKLTKTETALNQERQARMKAEETAKKKSTSEATVKRLSKQLEEWKAALSWMIPAAIAAAQDGTKARSRKELQPFAERAGGLTRGTYFEAWRAALPDDLCDKNDRANLSQIDDEPIEE